MWAAAGGEIERVSGVPAVAVSRSSELCRWRSQQYNTIQLVHAVNKGILRPVDKTKGQKKK